MKRIILLVLLILNGVSSLLRSRNRLSFISQRSKMIITMEISGGYECPLKQVEYLSDPKQLQITMSEVCSGLSSISGTFEVPVENIRPLISPFKTIRIMFMSDRIIYNGNSLQVAGNPAVTIDIRYIE
jgi:hypothetical protein